ARRRRSRDGISRRRGDGAARRAGDAGRQRQERRAARRGCHQPVRDLRELQLGHRGRAADPGGRLTDLAALPGKPGPHRTEQASSHPHDVVFDPRDRFIVVPDKGLDATFVFSLDAASGKLVPAASPPAASRPGAGPRHAAYHPAKPYAYVLNELDSTITSYRFDGERGALTPLQVITTLPSSFTGNNTTSEIVVAASGRFVYASNRGHDSLAIFAVDDSSGTLSPVGWEPTQGKTPRF